MQRKNKIELVVNAGLQMIPGIGAPLASLYFGYKDEQRFQRLENTLNEIATELQNVKLAALELHNRDELMSLIDEVTDSIENERIEYKRILYKNYFKKLLITPTNNNYEERKLYLDILNKITPFQIELFIFVMQNPNVIDIQITKPGVDKTLIQSCLLQLQNYGLIIGTIHSISIGGNNSGIPYKLNISETGIKFNNFCLK